MDTLREIEELQNRRAKLEEESHSLQGEQKTLEERVKMLEEKIAIEQLNKNIKATRDEISHLKSTLETLEHKFAECSQPPESPAPAMEKPPEPEVQEPKEEATAESAEATEPEETQEEIVTVAELENPIEQQEEFEDDLRSRSAKKRRRFF